MTQDTVSYYPDWLLCMSRFWVHIDPGTFVLLASCWGHWNQHKIYTFSQWSPPQATVSLVPSPSLDGCWEGSVISGSVAVSSFTQAEANAEAELPRDTQNKQARPEDLVSLTLVPSGSQEVKPLSDSALRPQAAWLAGQFHPSPQADCLSLAGTCLKLISSDVRLCLFRSVYTKTCGAQGVFGSTVGSPKVCTRYLGSVFLPLLD